VSGVAAPRSFKSAVVSSMGVATASTALAFVRQLMIAAYFGVSRGLEIYLFAYAVAVWVGFGFASVLDSMLVPHLVRQREEGGDEASRALARAIFLASAALGLAAAALTVGFTGLLAPLIATGFTPEERITMMRLSVLFVPWVVLYFVYYAAAARHKSAWRFNRVFVAELAVGFASIVTLALEHGSVRTLPVAYCAGYAAGVAWLLPGSGLLRRSARSSPIGGVLRDAAELYLTNQTGTVRNVIDRHFQSLIPAGGIAALGYASQLLMGLSSIIGMREIFVVPISESHRRNERVERLILGLLLLSVPLAGAVACFAPEIVTVLFQRGHFDEAAAEQTARVLRILSLTLVTGAVATPLMRVLQIVRRIRLLHIQYLAAAGLVLVFGTIFVQALGLGAEGIAWMNLATSLPGCCILVHLAGRCGVALNWRPIGGCFAFAVLAAGIAATAALGAAAPWTNAWARLLVGGPVYAGLVAALYGLFWTRLPYAAR
jgi:putative peptidoglycan lipid II flippase